MNMDIYFNDYKFEEQCLEFGSVSELWTYLEIFFEMCSSIKEHRKKISGLPLSFFASKQMIGKVLQQIDSKEFALKFFLKLDRVNVKYCDTPGKSFKNDQYYYYWIDNINHNPPISINVNEFTISDALEKKRLYGNPTLLINLPGMFFKGHKTHKLLRQSMHDIEDMEYHKLECSDSVVVMGSWIECNADPDRYQYDLSSGNPPRDEQTCLRNAILFEKVNLTSRQAGRALFKNKKDNTYWYVDNLHFGKAAHLEVFDERGFHIGESSLEGEVDESKRDGTKRINP